MSEQEGVVGVGETYTYLMGKEQSNEKTHNFCSCSKKIKDCEFWHSVGVVNRSCSTQEELEAEYQKIIATEGSHVIVDSSKQLWYLEKLRDLAQKHDEVDLKVVFLIRDVRGWVASRKELVKRDGGSQFLISIRSILNWYSSNKKRLGFLRQNKIDHLVMSYEEFALAPKRSADRLVEYLNLSDTGKRDLSSHILFGNRTKLSKTFRLRYDSRWFNDYVTQVYLLVFFPVFFGIKSGSITRI